MAMGFMISITDGNGEVLHRSFLREGYGADLLAETIGKHVARFRGEIFAADRVTVTVVHEDNPNFAELPARPEGDDGNGAYE